METLSEFADWLSIHPGFSGILIVVMIVLVAAALACYLARDIIIDNDDPDEHAKNHIRDDHE